MVNLITELAGWAFVFCAVDIILITVVMSPSILHGGNREIYYYPGRI